MWAKHLFSQLFGEPDADNDVSPETEDPTLSDAMDGTVWAGFVKEPNSYVPFYGVEGGANQNGNGSMETDGPSGKGSKPVERISTRDWAEKNEYDPDRLFFKVSAAELRISGNYYLILLCAAVS